VLVIYDLEFTTWDGAQSRGWTGPGEFREIVQIGALRVVPDTLVVDAEFEILVKPSRNPDVSDFFAALTGIDRSAVEQRGTDFLTALNAFLDFCDGSYALSYGNDMVVIGENIVLQIPEGRAPARPLPRASKLFPGCVRNAARFRQQSTSALRAFLRISSPTPSGVFCRFPLRGSEPFAMPEGAAPRVF